MDIGENMLKKITHWLVEFSAALIVLSVGAALILFLPADKQGQIQTAFYTGSAAWAVVLVGALGIVNSVRRGIFRKVQK